MDRKNERRRTYNAFRNLNSLIFQFRARMIFGEPDGISSAEARKYLHNISYHYYGRIDPAKEDLLKGFIKRAYALIDIDYICTTSAAAEELNTLQMDVTRVIWEMETAKKLADRRNWKTE